MISMVAWKIISVVAWRIISVVAWNSKACGEQPPLCYFWVSIRFIRLIDLAFIKSPSPYVSKGI